MAAIREVAERSGAGRFDRFLRSFAPGFVARREEARLRCRRVELASRIWGDFEASIERDLRHGRGFKGYQGASKKRGYASWKPGSGSADDDILDDLEDLRNRSRDLIRNDCHAAGLIDTWVANVVGSGLRPQCRINAAALGISEAQAEEFRTRAEGIFRSFWRRADSAGLLSFGRLQALAVRQVWENGDVVLIPRPNPALFPSLQLQIVEADRVMTPHAKVADPYYRDGIRINDRGEHVSISVKNTHPGDQLGKLKWDDFVEIPIVDASTGLRNVFHLMNHQRPGQSRGVPALAPALLLFRDLAQYFRAELTAAKVAACFAVFVTTPDPLAMAGGSSRVAADGKRDETLEPGMVRYLSPGEAISSATPGRPNTAFDQFVMRMLRAIGTTVRTPYELVSQDFSQTTYTSGRMALNEVRRAFTDAKAWLVEELCQPIWERVLEEAFLAGELQAPGFYENWELYTQARWVGPGWTWVDPQKEVAATVQAMESNLTTFADECAARGLDWEEVLEQRSREVKKVKELGLAPVPPAPEAPPAGGDGAGDDAGEGDEGGGDGEDDEETTKETDDGSDEDE